MNYPLFINSLDAYSRVRLGGALRYRLTSMLRSVLPIASLAKLRYPCRGKLTDILILHPTGKSKARLDVLVEALESRGVGVTCHCVDSARSILLRRKLKPVTDTVAPRRWRLQHYYAEWLLSEYSPRLVLTLMDDNLLTPFLRERTGAKGCILVNSAHSLCWPTLDFSMLDVDWFIVFGKSSMERLKINPHRYGHTKFKVLGSPFLNLDPPSNTISETHTDHGVVKTVLWLDQISSGDRYRDRKMRQDFNIFRKWVMSRPEITACIRPHPESTGARLRRMRRLNLNLLPEHQSLSESLAGVDVAVTSFSSALIEAAALGVPGICFKQLGLRGGNCMGEFGFEAVNDETELNAAFDGIVSYYGAAQESAVLLALEHLERLENASPLIAEFLMELMNDGKTVAADGQV